MSVAEDDPDRVVVRAFQAAAFGAVGRELAPVKHLVDVEEKAVSMICYHRAEGGLGHGILEIVAADCSVSV